MSRPSRRGRSRSERPGRAGFLVVDKPAGWTSHDVVDAARGWLGTRRVGHLGTLDPSATGVLPLAVREATKLVPYLESGRKRYVGVVRLGEETVTLDSEGPVERVHEGPLPKEAAVREAFAAFLGRIEQVPPMYSAVKDHGVPLYRRARRGEEVERAPRTVTVHDLRLTRYEPPDAHLDVTCAAGTYVRVLAADIGRQLGCGAYLLQLQRIWNEPFTIEQALPVEQLEEEARSGEIEARLIPPAEALRFPVVRLAAHQAVRVSNGGAVVVPGTRAEPGARLSGLGPDGEMLAVLEALPDRSLRPVRVLRPLAPQK